MKKNYYIYSGMYLLYFFGLMLVSLTGLAVYTSKSIYVFLFFLLVFAYFFFNLCKIISFRVTIKEGIVTEQAWFIKKREMKIAEIEKINLRQKGLPVFSFFANFPDRNKWYNNIVPPALAGMEMISFEKDYPPDIEDASVDLFPSLPVNPKIVIAIKELKPDVKINGEVTSLLPWKLKKKIGVSFGDKVQLVFSIAVGIFFAILIFYAIFALFFLK
ncbi:MAG TPA: hypothetical protein VMD74_01145 [Candidatus Methylomirabilis sp.]|nr:hypothetical protein [Candidatus Methylomirabilis sp.]